MVASAIVDAIVDSHLIDLRGEVHTGISGWHSLYDNNVGNTSKVMNYYKKCKRNRQEPTTLDNENEYENPIQVILTGPFNFSQKQLVKRPCLVRLAYA